MPLSFRSESHGDIAFGFFNIESDMLLLENFFFFADVFCKKMIEISREDELDSKRFIPADKIDKGRLLKPLR